MVAGIIGFFADWTRQDFFTLGTMAISLFALRMIHSVHVTINSRMDQMLGMKDAQRVAAVAASEAVGVEKERNRER